MEFGLLLRGQLTILFSLFSTLMFVENTYVGRIYKYIKSCEYLRIGDDKGCFLLIFLVYSIASIMILEMLRSNDKVDRILYIQSCNFNNIFLLFLNFISTYIYKSLDRKTLDLFIFSIGNSALFIVSYLLGLRTVSGYAYMNYMLSNVLCVMFTYILKFDQHFEMIKRLHQGYRFYKFFN